MDRRSHIKKLLALGAVTAAPGALWAAGSEMAGHSVERRRPFGYKRSVSHCTVDDLEWEDLCGWLAREGVEAVDLVEEAHHSDRWGASRQRLKMLQ